MRRSCFFFVLFATLVALVAAPAAMGQELAVAAGDGSQEVPALITPGTAVFLAEINDERTQIDYELEYQTLRGTPTQAHIHLAQEGVNGGVMLFVCTNLGNGPVGTPACPVPEGTVTGTWTEDSVIPIPNQGINGGPLALKRVIKAMRTGTAYLNLHTDLFPAGELRGQIRGTLKSDRADAQPEP